MQLPLRNGTPMGSRQQDLGLELPTTGDYGYLLSPSYVRTGTQLELGTRSIVGFAVYPSVLHWRTGRSCSHARRKGSCASSHGLRPQGAMIHGESSIS